MTIRIVILGALSLVFVVGGLGALWSATIAMLGDRELTSALVEDREAWARAEVWLNMLFTIGGPFVGAGLIAGVGALALVVRARQVAAAHRAVRQAGSASATASRETALS